MKPYGWRLGGVVAFAVFALLELGDWAGLVPGYGDPAAYAALVGITPQAEGVRLVILTVLALSVAVAALATVCGLLLRASWTAWAVRVTGGAFGAYGVYQVVSALSQLTRNQVGVAVAGIVYVLMGVLAAWVGSRAVRAA